MLRGFLHLLILRYHRPGLPSAEPQPAYFRCVGPIGFHWPSALWQPELRPAPSGFQQPYPFTFRCRTYSIFHVCLDLNEAAKHRLLGAPRFGNETFHYGTIIQEPLVLWLFPPFCILLEKKIFCVEKIIHILRKNFGN